jgi:hypothetical protein
MGQLPGARREGELVTELLRQEKFETESLIFGNASDTLLKLLTKKHKIIHLAGHGLFNYGEEKNTGMVIGNNTFLLPGQLAGMSDVPELVFVNCCYLGQMDSGEERGSQNRNRFAANIGTQLIDNGVRAVIVAGWAVDDAAAYDFAKLFYQFMFTGLGFGESVKRARKKIYEDYGNRTNTWGAFQCYGDPFYTLTDKKQSNSENNSPLLQEEIEIELLNLIHKLETSNYDVDKIIKRVMEFDQMIFKSSERNDTVLEYLAKLYGSLNLYKDAIRIYQVMMKSKKNGFSVKALEQYCNIRVKECVMRYKNKELSNKETISIISEVLKDLESLNRFGETIERWSLIGSAYKRLILLSEGDHLVKMLSGAIGAYENASNLAHFEDAYPLTNWLQLLQIRNELEKKVGLKHSPLKARTAMSEILERIEESYSPKSSYWDISAKANIHLTYFLLDASPSSKNKVMESYDLLWKKAGSIGQKQTELEHFDCLIHSFAAQKTKSDLVQKLLEIKKELTDKL